MKGKGILLNDEYDLQVLPVKDADNKIVSGVIVGNTLYQNQAIILIAQPGEIKQLPVFGVGINDIINDTDFLSWRRRVRQHMEIDGQTVDSVKFDLNKNLVIDAEYKD